MKKLQYGLLLLIVLACHEEPETIPKIDSELKVILESLPPGEFIAVSGDVIAIEDVVEPPAIISEHDPQPKIALVKVCVVLHGEVNSKTIRIAFATSQDVAWWNQTMAVEQGLTGTWILPINVPLIFKDFYPSLFSENGIYAIENPTKSFYDKAFCPVK